MSAEEQVKTQKRSREHDSTTFPEDAVFARNLNSMAQLFEGGVISLAAQACSAKLIGSDDRAAASDANAGHAKTYINKILGEVLKSIDTSPDPVETLWKFISKVLDPVGGAVCRGVSQNLRKSIETPVGNTMLN